MAQNKEQLEALLKFLDELCEEEGNEWFVEKLHLKYNSLQFLPFDGKQAALLESIDRLQKEYNHESSIDEHCPKSSILQFTPSNPQSNQEQKIDYIYEYCIEQILKKQARDFYHNFPIREIVPYLEEDYIRMESFHGRDKFVDFCVALYQQIEWMTNSICSNDYINKLFKSKQNDEVYTKKKDDKKVLVYQHVFWGNEQEKIDKRDKDLKKLPAIDKMRVVTYLLTMSEKRFDYNDFCYNLYQAYVCRCQNHRGGELTEKQKAIIDTIKPIKNSITSNL